MANPRVYYPIHNIGFAPLGTPHTLASSYYAAHGVQSIGINTNFNLEQVYQLGQLSIYENIEDIPDVEVTVEKVLDGRPLLQHLASTNASVATLAGRYNDAQTMIMVNYYDITQTLATGDPLKSLSMSGMYISAINFNIPLEGNQTENVTLVGNNKTWTDGVTAVPFTTGEPAGAGGGTYPFIAQEGPLGSGGVQRRENVVMASSFWPTELPNIRPSNYSSTTVGLNVPTGGGTEFASHMQSVSISTNLNRTELFELGRRGPYHRYVEFPVEVTCSIEQTASELGDNIDAAEESENLTDQWIRVRLSNGIIIDLGRSNKLQSVNLTGGDAGGGNATVTYNYSTFNDLTVVFPSGDPAGLGYAALGD